MSKSFLKKYWLLTIFLGVAVVLVLMRFPRHEYAEPSRKDFEPFEKPEPDDSQLKNAIVQEYPQVASDTITD